MCGRFTLRAKLNLLLQEFACDPIGELEMLPRYNIAPTQDVAIIRQLPDQPRRQLSFARWGLIPFWSKDATIAAKLINARAETIAEKPSFRSAFKRRRCLIPADGYYEWQKIGSGKQPYLIHFTDDRPFAFAGLWETWRGPHRDATHENATVEWETCTVITTSASERTRAIHDRMPVILAPADYDRWLDPHNEDAPSLLPMLQPSDDPDLTTTPVSSHVNNARHEGPACLQPHC